MPSIIFFAVSAPLPKPPDGFTLREVVRTPTHCVRMASDGQGNVIYVLTENGDVWRLDPNANQFRQILWAKRYLERRPGDLGGPIFVLGLALDKQGRLYVASNQLLVLDQDAGGWSADGATTGRGRNAPGPVKQI